MKEIRGNLWDYEGQKGYVICITTNGFVKNNGHAVMGRGCALEAAKKMPTLPVRLGDKIKYAGNHCHWMALDLFTFPVKHVWWDPADITLIDRSAKELREQAELYPDLTFILPRPGCGNGGLKWEDVRPVIAGILPDNVWAITT